MQSRGFLLLYGLAAAGGAIAYVPFLTILLPMRVTELAGSEDVQWLAYATFAGAIAASGANILFGWLSDLTRRRRPWILAGLAASSAALVSFAQVESIEATVALVVVWQVALNMMLSPLAAWAGDAVPDAQKGLLGGLLAFSPAAGAMATAAITLPGLATADARLWLVAGIVAVCVLPAFLFVTPRPFPELNEPAPAAPEEARDTSRNRVVRMWLARLLIQISEAALFAYLYFWFRSIDPAIDDAWVAQIFSLILIASIPLALLTGTWADRHDRPFLPLPITAGLAAVGLAIMALSGTLAEALAGYVVFGIAATIFLSLHTGQTLRVLPKPARRGRDLGIFNLTNTGPSIIMPWLALGLIPVFGFEGLFWALTACAICAAAALVSLPRLR